MRFFLVLYSRPPSLVYLNKTSSTTEILNAIAQNITWVRLRMLHLNHLRRSGASISTAKYLATTCGIRNLSSSASESGNTSSDDDPQSSLLKSTIRVDLLAQQAATALASGRSLAAHRRPDYSALLEEETEHLQKLKSLAPQYNTRPSALGPLASLAFGALGAASALAPPRLSSAISAGVQDAMTDVFNEQLREMREAGVAESAAAEEVRLVIRELRDQERAPAGAPRVPDILSLRNPRDITPAEGVAAVIKAGTKILLDAAKKV
jgi:demethoxyubiquinone hydroxylase (CLK1/Coq7/Cat5 family)